MTRSRNVKKTKPEDSKRIEDLADEILAEALIEVLSELTIEALESLLDDLGYDI